VRRILATLVLAAISFTLVPLTLLGADEDTPACCRKDGKHKCAMSGMEDESGPTLHPVSQCPMLPPANAAPISAAIAVLAPKRDQIASITATLNSPEQAEAQYHVSFSRSRQKRGPPHTSL